MAARIPMARFVQFNAIAVSVILFSAQFAAAQYTWVTDSDNSANWAGVANWNDGASNTTFPNAIGATVTFNAPVTVPNPTNNYTISLQTNDIKVGQITVNNAAFANNYNVNFTNGNSLTWQMNAGDPTILAKYIETVGTAAGGSTRYTFNQAMNVLSDWEITQSNVVNLNTGTTFTGIVNGAAERKIIKEGDGGIQFNSNLSLFPSEGFFGEFVINQGAIRMLGPTVISKAKAVTVTTGGQLQLADNSTTVTNPDWSLGTGASLFLNGTGKDSSVATITNTEGALRIAIQASRTTTFHNPVVLQSDSVISVTTANSTGVLEQAVSGAGGLTKHGGGILALSSPDNSYQGDTKFANASSGTLSLVSPFLADGRDVYLTTGALLDLNFIGTDTIRSLYIDGVAQAVGTWGNASQSPTNPTALITGTGLLNVTTVPSVGVPGDYNGNGNVDAADYVLWRKGGPLQNEVDSPGTVNAQDYVEWRSRLGNAGSGSGLGTTGGVPEPGTLMLTAMVALAAIVCRRN